MAPTVGQIGEKQTIERLKCYMASESAKVLVGPGDDCAVVSSGEELQSQVLTTDLLIEGTHFSSRETVDWVKLGRKCIAANYSDIAAMGAFPQSVLVSLGVPASLEVRCLEQLYSGLSQQVGASGGNLLGGDMARSEYVIINIAVTGVKSPKAASCTRSSCQVGQNVYVSGALGGSRAGLEIVLGGSRVTDCLPEDLASRLVNRHLLPEPRLALGQHLASKYNDVAIIDISDSLHNELGILASASGKGMHVHLELLPAFPGVERYCATHEKKLQDYVLFSGEEYELLFTCFAAEEELRTGLTDAGVDVTVSRIGTVCTGGEIVYTEAGGQTLHIRDNTFSHFTERS